MNPIYDRLFAAYGSEVLKNVENYDEAGPNSLLDGIPLEQPSRLRLPEAIFDRYLQWSSAAFAAGLHLGLSLLRDDVRRPGPQ